MGAQVWFLAPCGFAARQIASGSLYPAPALPDLSPQVILQETDQ